MKSYIGIVAGKDGQLYGMTYKSNRELGTPENLEDAKREADRLGAEIVNITREKDWEPRILNIKGEDNK